MKRLIAILLCLCLPCSEATIVRVQPATPGSTTDSVCASGSTSATENCSFLTTPTVGNCIHVVCGTGAITTWNTPIDNQSGNTYTLITSTNAINPSIGLWRSKIVGASGTFTVTCSGSSSSGFPAMLLGEYSGEDCTAAGYDGAIAQTDSTVSTFSSNSITTTNANDLLYGACVETNNGSGTLTWTPNTTAPNNFTLLNQITDISNFEPIAAQDQIVSATNVYTSSFTISGGGSVPSSVGCVFGAFKATGGAAATPSGLTWNKDGLSLP